MPMDLLTIFGVHWASGKMESLFDSLLDSFGLVVFQSSSFVVSLGFDNAHFTHFRCLNFDVHYYPSIRVSRFPEFNMVWIV